MSVVVVSWILALLAAFGLTYSQEVRSEAQMVRLEIERQQLRAWAQSGVELGLAQVGRTKNADGDPWQPLDATEFFTEPLSCGEGWIEVGETVATDGRDFWFPGIVDEAGCLPVAIADSISLACLPGMTPTGARLILQAARDARGNSIPPFDLLSGLDTASRQSARHYLSRYGNHVNVNSAPSEVLIAVGLPKRAAEKLLKWRNGSDEIPSTNDDERFTTLDGADPGVRKAALNSEEAAVLAFLKDTGRLTTESRFYSLTSRAWAAGMHGICEVRAVLQKRTDGPPVVIESIENWLN